MWHGSYRIEKLLGKGGFGVTYLATDLNLGNKVAIKEFFPQTFCSRDSDTSQITVINTSNTELVEKLKKKFLKEARNLARLSNPYIVKVHSAFEDNDTAYYVMDFLAGENLQDKVRREGPMTQQQALAIIDKVGNALDYVHSRQINHLDVKPANIMLDDHGQPHLIDFGLSKQYDKSGSQTSTTPVGISHGYAPIEQYTADGVKEFSPRIDIYALGATLYFLLTGTTPPDASALFEEQLRFPQSVSPVVQQAILKAMAPVKMNRQATVKEFIDQLHGKMPASSRNQSTVLINPAHPSVPVPPRQGMPAANMGGAPGSPTGPVPPQGGGYGYQQPSPSPYGAGEEKSNKLLYIIGGAVAAVILLLVIIFFANSGNDTPTAPAMAEEQVAAEPASTKRTDTFYLKGTVNGKYSVKMYIDPRNMRGRYYYDRTGSVNNAMELELTSFRESGDDYVIEMDEYSPKGEYCGHWSGKITPEGVYSGSGDYHGKTMPFYLEECKRTDTQF